MFNFFDQIGGIISSVVDFFVNLFKYLLEFFEMIRNAFLFFIEVASVLPTYVKGGILCIVGVSVLYLIIGRE